VLGGEGGLGELAWAETRAMAKGCQLREGLRDTRVDEGERGEEECVRVQIQTQELDCNAPGMLLTRLRQMPVQGELEPPPSKQLASEGGGKIERARVGENASRDAKGRAMLGFGCCLVWDVCDVCVVGVGVSGGRGCGAMEGRRGARGEDGWSAEWASKVMKN
jgi:hypothetical protein